VGLIPGGVPAVVNREKGRSGKGWPGHANKGFHMDRGFTCRR